MGKFYLQTTGELIILHPFCIRKVFLAENSSSKPSAVEKKMQISGVKTYKGHCIYQPKQNRKSPTKFTVNWHCIASSLPKKESYPNKLQHATTKCRVVFFSWCDAVAFLSFSRGFILGSFFLQVAKKMGEPSQVVQFILTIENHNFFGMLEWIRLGKKCRPKSSSCIRKTFLCISYVVY